MFSPVESGRLTHAQAYVVMGMKRREGCDPPGRVGGKISVARASCLYNFYMKWYQRNYCCGV
jgi:hypothetical protein